MSAEVLRRAAALMRERARANEPEDFAWWSVVELDRHTPREFTTEHKAHIASWHPVVALAVADWLDASYDDEVRFRAQGAVGFLGENPAFAVARAYLGDKP